MSSFKERLAAAKEAARPTRDVQVLLDENLSDQNAALLEELQAAHDAEKNDPRLTGSKDSARIQKKLDELHAAAADSLVTLRFTRLPGDQWAEITARCTPRLDVPLDRRYGYNMTAVSKLAAPISGVRVEGDDLVPLVVEKATKESPAVDEWADLFALMSGHEFGLIQDAIYDLNEYEPAARVGQLKKELATRTA